MYHDNMQGLVHRNILTFQFPQAVIILSEITYRPNPEKVDYINRMNVPRALVLCAIFMLSMNLVLATGKSGKSTDSPTVSPTESPTLGKSSKSSRSRRNNRRLSHKSGKSTDSPTISPTESPTLGKSSKSSRSRRS